VSLTAGCTNNGRRGQRILGVAFVFGSMLLLRGLGLMSFVLQHYNHIHKAVHSEAAAPLALLFEWVMLVITLRLLMPPGTADGDRDPNWTPAVVADSTQYTDSEGNYTGHLDPTVGLLADSVRRHEAMRVSGGAASSAALYESAGRVPSRLPPGYSSPDATPDRLKGGVPAGHPGRRGRGSGPHSRSGRPGAPSTSAHPAPPTRGPPLSHHPQRSAWAGAHAVDGYHDDDGSNPNSSWRLAEDTTSAARIGPDDDGY